MAAAVLLVGCTSGGGSVISGAAGSPAVSSELLTADSGAAGSPAVSSELLTADSSCADQPNGTLFVRPPADDDGTAPAAAGAAGAPEIPAGYRTGMLPVATGQYAAATANPLASRAACRVLAAGGTAADAAVAAQLVLGLVEPQATGIGGGGFLLYYDAATGTIDAYDGRETAPATATEDYLRWISATDHTAPQPTPRASGRSIGTPGVIRLLEAVHTDHGKQPWTDLFTPAIGLAAQGFPISPRMGAAVAAAAPDLAADPTASEYFLNPDGSPKTTGTTLTNPDYATTLQQIANHGADAFYTGDLAAAIVTATADTTTTNPTVGRTPGVLSITDLAGYQVQHRTAVCGPYRTYQVCGMSPPSSGGITTLATLGILDHFDLGALAPKDPGPDGGDPTLDAAHLISEAERLAYADRDTYVADPGFVPLPGGSPQTMLDPQYLAGRARLIDPDRSMGTAQPGNLGQTPLGSAPTPEGGTSHLTIADSYGNVATMTTSVESAFGSYHMTHGFLLNNQLTDFSPTPTDPSGALVANRVEPGKRPRSSMAPTLVFTQTSTADRGDLILATGSPGGSAIIQYVVKTLVATLDWHLNPQQAVGMVDFGAANTSQTNIGSEHPTINPADNGAHDHLVQGLIARGHHINLNQQISGTSVLQRTVDGTGWVGGSDPRREGTVLGDPPPPMNPPRPPR